MARCCWAEEQRPAGRSRPEQSGIGIGIGIGLGLDWGLGEGGEGRRRRSRTDAVRCMYEHRTAPHLKCCRCSSSDCRQRVLRRCCGGAAVLADGRGGGRLESIACGRSVGVAEEALLARCWPPLVRAVGPWRGLWRWCWRWHDLAGPDCAVAVQDVRTSSASSASGASSTPRDLHGAVLLAVLAVLAVLADDERRRAEGLLVVGRGLAPVARTGGSVSPSRNAPDVTSEQTNTPDDSRQHSYRTVRSVRQQSRRRAPSATTQTRPFPGWMVTR